jgi:hypothetical protein
MADTGGRPFKTGHDERRGHGPEKGAANAGRPPEAFKEAMRTLVNRAETMDRLKQLLESEDDRVFLDAYKFASDRAYGRPSAADEHDRDESRQLIVRMVRE